MSWKKEVFASFKLYAVTDVRAEDAGILKKIDAAYAGGADIIQLRAKGVSDRYLYETALKIRRIANRRRKLFFVNDRPDLALAVNADGVHLGQNDLPVDFVRALCRKFGKRIFIGKSTHSIAQARLAVNEKVDYIGVGPVFKTPTKPDYKPAGLKFVSEAAREIKVPFVCIGGIDHSNLEQVLSAGAKRIAVVRAIFSSRRPYEAARKLREKISNR
jgi:thiamine-phosphate pyrophosphorylase